MKKLGLCLSGGGAKGAYQIGALTALKELGIYDSIEVMAGTSIGSVNAAVVGSNSVEVAKDFWFSFEENPLKMKNIMDTLKDEKLKSINSGIYSIEPLTDVLVTGVNYEKIKDKDIYITVTESGEHKGGIKELIRSSFNHYVKNESKAVYLNLKDLEPEMLREAVKASCSIPVVFSPVVFEGKQYFDGGVVDNAPIKPLIDAGCNEVILINISMMNTSYELNKKAEGITLHKIQSKKYLGSMLDFSATHSEKLFRWGYEDTINYFQENELVLDLA